MQSDRAFFVVLAFVGACVAEVPAASDGRAADGEDGVSENGDGDPSDREADQAPALEPEQCDRYDDDGDGEVDEGCGCAPGESQDCYPGPRGQDGVGICEAGTQDCDDSDPEFPVWGPCRGAVTGGRETCGDGIDSDCDGVDPSCDEERPRDDDEDDDGPGGPRSGCAEGETRDCYSGPAGTEGVGLCEIGLETCASDGTWGPCVGAVLPVAEVCGDGVDQDCNGSDEGCEVVEVDLFIIGDCVTASCPAEAPFPVGCDVSFTPGDDRGCVASTPGDSTVYFQAGDECDEGLVMGTLYCSTSMGAPLDAESCPINKPVPIYAEEPDGCPETH